MQEIPNWIIKVIETENLVCRHCDKGFEVGNLMSIGIQESSKSPHQDTLCIGMFCSKCEQLIIFELKEMTLINFAFEILDQETANKIKKDEKETPAILDGPEKNKGKNKRKRSRPRKSRITQKDVEEAKNFLKPKDLLHEDFLIALGMLPEEIIKYNYKK